MTLFYVMGGGWGHLFRVRTFVNQQRLSSFQIVTNNPLASKLFDENEIFFVKGDTPEALASQIKVIFQKASTVFMDTFPAGLFGELQGLQADHMYYLARRLRWNAYKEILNHFTVHFEHTFRLEELEVEHEKFIQTHSRKVSNLRLHYPVPAPERIPMALVPTGRPIWIIVHAFIQEEVEVLVHYAKEAAARERQSPTFVLLSDQIIADKDVVCHTYAPACDWFPLADKIFVGGGFNTMQQVRAYAHKVKAIPFPRKFDDQGWRIRQDIGRLS